MSLLLTREVLVQVEYTVFRDSAGAYVAEDHPDATPVRCDPAQAAIPITLADLSKLCCIVLHNEDLST